jgi:glycosyltransferase involved in cell wall biosynthesis
VFFLGFTDDKTRDWLYSAALAFVFPSIYEGFGLPVLEAMQYHTPVIAYDNKAIREVAGDYPIYANDPLSMVESVRYLSNLDKKELSKLTDKAYHHSSRYTWKRTAESILEIISAQYNNTQQS